MKVNTSISAHWRNETYRHLPVANISKATGDIIVKQHFHLFSLEALEQLMNDVDDALGRKRKKIGIHDLLTYRAH